VYYVYEEGREGLSGPKDKFAHTMKLRNAKGTQGKWDVKLHNNNSGRYIIHEL